MEIKIFRITALYLILGAGILSAQTEVSVKKYSCALLFGNNVYLSEPAIPASPGTSDWNVSGEAPNASGISETNNIMNMVGGEFRYFTSEKFAFKFNGTGIYKNTPARENVKGVTPATSAAIDPSSPNAGWIPNYDATVMNNSLNVNVSIGGEFHLANIEKVSPYIGIMVPFAYVRSSQYDPTVNVDITKSTVNAAVTITDVGVRHIETIGFGGQLVFGADYNITERFFFGMEIKPVSYLYAYNTKFPAPGLETRKADTHTYGFFTQPVVKIGFRL